MYAYLYLKWVTMGPIICTELYQMLCMAWMGEGVWKMDI